MRCSVDISLLPYGCGYGSEVETPVSDGPVIVDKTNWDEDRVTVMREENKDKGRCLSVGGGSEDIGPGWVSYLCRRLIMVGL